MISSSSLSSMPLIARGEAYAHLGDLRSAASNYRKALSMLGDTALAHDLRWRLAQLLDALAVVTFREGAVDGAIRLINEALEETVHPGIELHKATFLASRGDFAHAEPIAQELVTGCTKSIEPEATVLLARILIAYRRDFAKAKELLEKAAELHSSHPQVISAWTLFESAVAKFRVVAESTLNVEQLSRCIKAFPEDAELYRIRALAYTSQVDYKSAVKDLFTCLSISGGSNAPAVELMVTVLATIGDELAESSDYTSAVYYYTEGLKWATQEAARSQVLIARGDCHLALDKHEEALQDFKAVLEMDPANDHAQERLGHLHDVWGSVMYNEGKYDLAEVEYTRAIEYCDTNPHIFYHRALTRAHLGKDAMMVRDLISCRNLGVSDPRIVAMVNQFCVESGSAETCRMRDEDDKYRSVEANLIITTKKTEDEKRRLNRLTRTKGPDFNVGSLRTKHKDDLDGGVLTPANIRKFVETIHVVYVGGRNDGCGRR
jgi:tetratricopeptide (TPR) repeat protein